MSQNTYRINYVQEKYAAKKSKRNNLDIYRIEGRLVFNDSISLYYMPPNGNKKDELENLPVIGDKLIHHGLIFNSKNDEILEEVAWPKDKYFVIVDSPRHFNWFLNDSTKTILGQNCKMAYSVNKAKDTAMVWYSTELINAFGPAVFFGVPGVVLEVFDQSNNLHFIAEKIELTSLTLVLPQNVERITADKYRLQKAANK